MFEEVNYDTTQFNLNKLMKKNQVYYNREHNFIH